MLNLIEASPVDSLCVKDFKDSLIAAQSNLDSLQNLFNPESTVNIFDSPNIGFPKPIDTASYDIFFCASHLLDAMQTLEPDSHTITKKLQTLLNNLSSPQPADQSPDIFQPVIDVITSSSDYLGLDSPRFSTGFKRILIKTMQAHHETRLKTHNHDSLVLSEIQKGANEIIKPALKELIDSLKQN